MVSGGDPSGTESVLKQCGQGFVQLLCWSSGLWACKWQRLHVFFWRGELVQNVRIDETIQICLDTLYRSDIKPPSISEGVLKKLLLKATRGVEFSYNDKMYRQKDGVAMGSPFVQNLQKQNLVLIVHRPRSPHAEPHAATRGTVDSISYVRNFEQLSTQARLR